MSSENSGANGAPNSPSKNSDPLDLTAANHGGDKDAKENDLESQKEDHNVTVQQEQEQSAPKRLIYRLTDTPPVSMLFVFALQQTLLAISTPLGTTVLVAQAVCAKDEEELKTKIMCATMFMMGLSTFCMTTFGVRLPIFQGPSVTYIIPLLAMMSLDEFRCPETFRSFNPEDNTTTLMAVLDNQTTVRNYDVAVGRINDYAGSMVAAGAIHFLVGSLGLAGGLGRFVGPVTIVPTIALFGISIHPVVVSFAETNWPVALLTCSAAIVFSLYLGHVDTPIPMWSSKRGWHVKWYPIHQIISILLGVGLGWLVSYIMTEAGALSEDENSVSFRGRTDSRSHIIEDTDWFNFPYPGQFGMINFNLGAFVTFLVASMLSIVDSIADYNATAKAAYAVPPPKYALNRGIAVEGLMSILSGFLGCGHATVSYGENIGAISISKVASRRVFQVVGVLYLIFSVVSKVGAVFLIIPDAVIGGSQIITFGILIGVVLSCLDSIDMNSTRNLSIIGISILIGLSIPKWMEKNSDEVETGNDDFDNVVRVMLSNPSFIGAFLSCFLDNTIPGTNSERGIVVDGLDDKGSLQNLAGDVPVGDGELYETGPEVYRLPYVPACLRTSTLNKYIPLFDGKVD